MLYLINPLNAELNPICHLLALLGAHPIFHVSRKRVKHDDTAFFTNILDEESTRRIGLYLHYTLPIQQTKVHAPGGIRTRNSSGRQKADLRVRPHGQRDRV